MKTTHKVSISKFVQIIGCLVSFCPALRYYHKAMTIPAFVKVELGWSKNNISIANTRCDEYFLELFSDSSDPGLGVFCKGKTSHGWWNISQASKHINYKELLAVYY